MTDETAPAAFLCTFADWRTVKGRKQLQIILEAPIEKQGEILTTLGAPNPSDPLWVVLAPLTKEAAKAAQGAQAPVPTQDYSKLIQRAGILCTERTFWAFMREQGFPGCRDEHACADALRMRLDVGSRRDLATNENAREEFRKLDNDYRLWRRA